MINEYAQRRSAIIRGRMIVLNAFFKGMWVAIPVCIVWAIGAEFTGWGWMSALLPIVFLVCVFIGATAAMTETRKE